MNQNQLNKLIKELGIAKDHILREEAEMIILNELAQNKIGQQIVFYGGTALRLVYNSPRFSEDIDLLQIKPIKLTDFKKFLTELIDKQNNWKLTDIKNKRQTMFALINLNDEKLKHNFSIKIEIHKPAKKVKLKTNLAMITSPTIIFQPLLLVPTLLELKNLKLSALHNRQKGRDIFDLWYISQSLREEFVLPNKLPTYSAREFSNELQVFLPKKYYSVIKQLYDKITGKN